MRKRSYFTLVLTMMVAAGILTSGCAVNFYKQNPRSKTKIKDLEAKIGDLESQRRQEQEQFEQTKRLLEGKLRSQIADKDVYLEMDERGLVIILSDNILFDSGKAEVKKKAFPVLDNVAQVLNDKVPKKNIGISGNTDNVPITHSNWKSNWELSTARATNVLHYLESQGVAPKRLSATGYGEHRPIASNDTADGRARNRRVEIVILPQFQEKRETEEASIK